MRDRVQLRRACAFVGASLFLVSMGCSGDDGSSASSGGHTDASSTGSTTTADTTGTGSSTTAAGGSGTTTTADMTGTDASSSGSTNTTSGTGMQSPPDGSCRDDSDCDVKLGEFCDSPRAIDCGICNEPYDDCGDDADCAGREGTLCQEFSVMCPCDDALDHDCLPPCTSDDECDGGRACADDGHCVFVSCGDGYVCAETHDCSPGSGGNDCVRRTCDADPDCGVDGLRCVQGRCHASFGTCALPRPGAR